MSREAPVLVSLKDLASGKADKQLHAAFGPESLGILLVSGLSERYKQLRVACLDRARVLASLPEEDLSQLELAETNWATGWSRGRETLANGTPDNNKGSFYVNCNFVRNADLDGPDPSTVAAFPHSKGNIHSNVWPTEQQMPHFERDLKELISYMIGVAKEVAKACDRELHTQLQGMEMSLEEIVSGSDMTRARLLHYYKPEESQSQWCGEHLDHSCLTALTSALWGPGTVSEPTDGAGLYIRSRNAASVKVNIPDDCIAIQTGSALEVITKSLFKAVPHKVVGDSRFYRSTLAVFCQPRLEDKVGDVDFAEYSGAILAKFSDNPAASKSS